MQMTARTAAGPALLLLLVLLCFGDLSIACQGANDAAGGDNAALSSTKGSAKILERTENNIRGRKMMAGDHFTTTTEAEHVTVRAIDRKSSKTRTARQNYGARFVAFNEDYRGPRHHPPKNN